MTDNVGVGDNVELDDWTPNSALRVFGLLPVDPKSNPPLVELRTRSGSMRLVIELSKAELLAQGILETIKELRADMAKLESGMTADDVVATRN